MFVEPRLVVVIVILGVTLVLVLKGGKNDTYIHIDSWSTSLSSSVRGNGKVLQKVEERGC